MKIPRIIVVSGASGGGKTTAVDLLENIIHPHPVERLRNVTTRPPRPDDGVVYTCVSEGEFKEMQKAGAFLWFVHVHAYMYGTTREELLRVVQSEPCTITVIAPEMLVTFKDEAKKLGADESSILFLHVLSPGEDILRERLTKRGDKSDSIEYRINECKDWDAYVQALPLTIQYVRNDGSVENLENSLRVILS